MIKHKLCPGQKQLHYIDSMTLALCKQLHRQHASAKLAKNPELSVCRPQPSSQSVHFNKGSNEQSAMQKILNERSYVCPHWDKVMCRGIVA